MVAGTAAIKNPLTAEHKVNYVLFLFYHGNTKMVRSFVEEAVALASLSLFLGMIAIWAQVIAIHTY
jgi:hypothetical protein